MKNRFVLKSVLLIAGIALMVRLAMPVAAQGVSGLATGPSANPGTPSTRQGGQAELPPGVPDILKLARAAIGEDLIIAFVKSSGRSYDLSASQILHLKKEGVSERVIAAMLEQSMKPAQQVVPPAPQFPPAPAAPQPAYSSAPSVQSVPTYQEVPTVIVPASPVYVAPYPVAPYVYEPYGPYYYGGYWDYPSPSLSFSIGIGGYHSGFGGRGFHNGGFRGGHR